MPLRYDTVDEALSLFAPSEFIVGADEPAEFVPPVEVFPLFKKALAYYQDRNPGHAVQIDTVEGYEKMISAGSFESVPGVVPDGASDARAYHDGDCVFVSIMFALPDGSKRVASSAARPMNEEEFRGWGEILGADPVAFLAVLPDASRLATGKRLLRSAGDAAIDACSREDVIGMSAPVLVRVADSVPSTAPQGELVAAVRRCSCAASPKRLHLPR